MIGVAGVAGCFSTYGGEDDRSSESALSSDSVAPALSGDMVAAGDPSQDFLQAPAAPGSTGAPKVFYLAYADGHAIPKTSPNPCQKTAPKFVCDFASTLPDCQRLIQSYLDRWYSDFNIVFTLTRPTSGAFYTEVISSGGGAWCDAANNVAGIAPFLCDDLDGGVAYTFLGGKSAKETAIIIAQEQAHLVGLEHTLSTRDIMDPTICPNCDGFEAVDNKIQNDHCNRPNQNSYEMMRDRLGLWTGGIKPTPFGCQPDNDPPLVQILAPADNANVSGTFTLSVQASDACKVSRVNVAVAPMGLHAQSSAAPFEWTLTKIAGRQTITVTAVDPSGKQSSASITVNAGAKTAAGTGGAVGMGAGGATSTGPAPAEVNTAAAAAGCGCDIAGQAKAHRAGTTRWTSFGALLAAIAFVLGGRTRGSPAGERANRRRRGRGGQR
jgi:hypothetical protein